MPAKTPDHLLAVLARTQDAFDVLEANPNYEPHTAHAYFTGALGNVIGVKASGCNGCVQHCIGVKHDDNTNFWCATPTHKPRVGNRAHLAIKGPSDSFSSRYDEMEDIDKCLVACDHALNDTGINPKSANKSAWLPTTVTIPVSLPFSCSANAPRSNKLTMRTLLWLPV